MTSINFVKAQYPADERERAQSHTFHDRSQVVTPRAETMVRPLRRRAHQFQPVLLKRMSAMIFLRRLWKIPKLTRSLHEAYI
jgi:hypothetical protein